MLTLKKRVDIAADRRLRFDIPAPDDLPCGQAMITLRIEPIAPPPKTLQDTLWEKEEQRFQDALKEAEARAERERTDPVFRNKMAAIIHKCQEGPPLFGGIDGVEFQRKIRDEWED